MARSKIPYRKGKALFKAYANKTNVKNIPSRKPMMRGGYHY